MVNSAGNIGMAEVDPPWLVQMLMANFFGPCSIHGDSHKGECNWFCIDCSENNNVLCSYCLVHHTGHNLVQIRRSSYHDVVRTSDMKTHIDMDGIQAYTINSAKVMFLKERKQVTPRSGSTVFTCEICHRKLPPEPSRFCSLSCKLNAIGREGVQGLTFRLSPSGKSRDTQAAVINGYESDDPSMPRKVQSTQASGHLNISKIKGCCRKPSSPGDSTDDRSRNSRKRKGIPCRAPFF